MNKKYILVVAILLLLPIMAAADDAIPDVRNATTFQGRVTIDGSAAPDGTSVEAMAGTVLRGQADLGTKAGTYILAAGPGTETLTFYVRGIAAPQTYSLGSKDIAKTVTWDLSITTGGRSPGSSSSGGTGGGGSIASGEDAANIELIEKYDMTISKDVLTVYKFTHANNSIRFVNITGNTNAGVITTSVEVLKNTSSLVKTPPEGVVYKNSNIWVGTTGFATPNNIKEALINFRVTNAWMSSKGVSGSDMVLAKWSGTGWIQLETKELSKDDTYTYFSGKTNSFSPFAITTKTAVAITTGTVPAPVGTSIQTPEVTKTTAPVAKSSIWTWIIGLIILVVIGAAVYFFVLKK